MSQFLKTKIFLRVQYAPLLLLWLCSMVPDALAASGLSGSLTDPQGRPVPGATIRLLRRADASRRETRTDDQGRFSFGAIDPGEYRLTAEYVGFPVIGRTFLVAAVGQQTENLQFSEVASQSQSVTIFAKVSDA